jgi:5'(3')-deoxyribonucleotidase
MGTKVPYWEDFNSEWENYIVNNPFRNYLDYSNPTVYYDLTKINENDRKLWYLKKIIEYTNNVYKGSRLEPPLFKSSLINLVKEVLGQEYVDINSDELKKSVEPIKERIEKAIKELKDLQVTNFTQGRRRKPGSAKRKKKLGKKHNSRKKKQKKRKSPTPRLTW